MRFLPSLFVFLAFTCSTFAQTLVAPRLDVTQPLLQQGNARVVLVGDSITGQSRNHPAGYAYQLDWALQQAYPGCHPNIIALGGSGQGVQAWLNTEKRSRTDSFPLDVKGIDVKTELDQPADVLIVMLGMNDVLAPYVVDEPASLDQWAANYRELLKSLQSRLKPKFTAIATPTLCTEDDRFSPKNRMMAKLIDRLTAMLSQDELVLLPTHDTMAAVLAKGRRLKPDFHVTHDYVHPNEAGHLAIAIGMLSGLHETAAASLLEEKRLAKYLEQNPGDAPTLSYGGLRLSPLNKPERKVFFLDAIALPPKTGPNVVPMVEATGEGWEIQETSSSVPTTSFRLIGPADRHENPVKLSTKSISRDVPIPAPWLVAAGLIRKPWNEKQTLDEALFRGPIEEAIETRGSFTTANNPATDKPLEWKPYFATVDYTGGANPDSVDFAAVTHARNFEAGYGARWIHSDRDRPVNVELSTQAFAGTMQLGVWLNGASVYSSLLTGEPGKKKTVSAQLHTGWNALVFSLNHTAWQMQCTVHLAGIDGDSLDDLRYSITPQNVGL